VDPGNLSDVHKSFNKPADYEQALKNLAHRGIYAITSFIFGMDGDTPGVAERTAQVMEGWPPVLPVFSLLTPFPSTPLYKRLLEGGRLTRPKHWLDFRPFTMSFVPDKISINEAETEVREAWTLAYSPATTREAMRKISDRPALGACCGILRAPRVSRNLFSPGATKTMVVSVVEQSSCAAVPLLRGAAEVEIGSAAGLGRGTPGDRIDGRGCFE
jgi:hypothetical protein